MSTQKERDEQAERMKDAAKLADADKRQHISQFICMTCQDRPTFEAFDLFVNHLEQIHQVNVRAAEIDRQITLHLNGTNWYETHYDSTIIGYDVRFVSLFRNERGADDPMRRM